MELINSQSSQLLWFDNDAREVLLRQIVQERLAEKKPPCLDDYIVATYFFAFRSTKLEDAVEEISYHATSGIHHPPVGSLLEQCSAKPVGVDYFDSTGRLGLLHVAFPLKMMLQADGHLTSCDILHTTAGAIIFDVYENQDARLISLQIPENVLSTFPGPAYGPMGLRRRTNFAPDQPAFGTILKPTAGITPDDVGRMVAEVAGCPLFMFIKEDEDLYPNLDYSPVRERARKAMTAVAHTHDQRGGTDILFAPHISSAPHEVLDTLHAVMEEGVTAVMFSETFAGGTLRMVREETRSMPNPPALYLHNAGIGVKARGIWREVIDFLARLDGMDIRQTAPVRPGKPFLRPYGAEWEASEEILSREIPGIQPTMIARAGSLDQGNIGLNLADAERRGLTPNILYLAGSAINSIKNEAGVADPHIGTEAMREAIELYYSGALKGIPDDEYTTALVSAAIRNGYKELVTALRQRYPLLKF